MTQGRDYPLHLSSLGCTDTRRPRACQRYKTVLFLEAGGLEHGIDFMRIKIIPSDSMLEAC